VQIWHIYLFSLILGIVNTLDFPAQQTFIGDLSGMGQVRQAITLNIMGLQAARMLGPAIAGVTLKLVGSAAAFWINGASFVVVLISLLMVRSHQAESKHSSGRGQFRETLQFIRGQPRMIDLMVFATMVTFFGLSIFNILPSVADHVLKGDSQTFGLLLGSSGAGALVSTLILLPLSQSSKYIGRIIIGAATWMGMFFLLLSQSTWLPLSMAAIFCVSLGAPLVLTTGLGVLQMLAPVDMRARIISLFTMLTFGLQPLASLVIGYSAELISTRIAILINAVCLLTGALLMLFLRQGLRQWELHPVSHEIVIPKAE
jgi:MFS family permease